MRKRYAFLIILMLIFSITPVISADDKITSDVAFKEIDFGNIINKAVNSLKNVFKGAVGFVGTSRKISPQDLTATVDGANVLLNWEEKVDIQDTLKPEVNLITPQINEIIQPGTQVEITCSAIDDIGLNKIELWIGGPPNSDAGSANEAGGEKPDTGIITANLVDEGNGILMASSEGFRLDEVKQVSGTTATVKFLRTFTEDGIYPWNCKAYDINGNSEWGYLGGKSSAFVIQDSISLDTVKPTVTLMSPTNSPIYPPNQEIEFTCNVGDNLELDRVEFWLSAGNNFYVDQALQVNGNTQQLTFKKTFTQDGNYAWNCKAIDKNGNSQFGSINGQSPGFKVQQGAQYSSELIIDLIAPINEVIDANAPVLFTCYAQDDVALSKAQLWVTGPGLTWSAVEEKQTTPTNDANAIFTRTFTQEGNYAWNCKFYNSKNESKFGNVNGQSPGFTIVNGQGPDTIKPTVTLISPIHTPALPTYDELEFSCNVEDNVGLSGVELWVSDNSGLHVDQVVSLNPGSSGRVKSKDVVFKKTFTEDGLYAWNCKAYDESGNSAYGDIFGVSPAFKIKTGEYFSGYRIYKVNLANSQETILVTNTQDYFNCDNSGCSYLDSNSEVGNYKYHVVALSQKGLVETETASSNEFDVTVNTPNSPSPGGDSGGGGGGSSGGSRGDSFNNLNCDERWLCGSWGACTNNVQKRTCSDLNNCNNAQHNIVKPSETRTCTTLQNPPNDFFDSGDQQGGEFESVVKNSLAKQLLGIFIIIVLLSVIVLIIFRKRIFGTHPEHLGITTQSKNVFVTEDVLKAVKNSKKQGYKDFEIRESLKESGWNKDQVNEIMKKA